MRIAEKEIAYVNEQALREMIEERAYLKYAGRGFQGGAPLEDWLEAERLDA